METPQPTPEERYIQANDNPFSVEPTHIEAGPVEASVDEGLLNRQQAVRLLKIRLERNPDDEKIQRLLPVMEDELHKYRQALSPEKDVEITPDDL